MSSRTVERYGGIWLDKVNKLNPVEFTEDLVTEKRVRDVSIDIFDKLKTASVQIIPAEVKGIIYNEKDVEATEGVDSRHIGCVKVDCFPGFELPSQWVYPIEGNIKKYPVVGEMVAVLCLGDQAFYFNPINLKRAVNNNAVIGATNTQGRKLVHDRGSHKINLSNFKAEPGRPTRQIAGDIVIDGRDRQSIKLGKNDEEKNGPVIKLRISNTEQDPNNLKIYSPKEENIVLDAASIYMTENETVKLTPARNVNEFITPTSHSGKQILIDSDKLVFNTKLGDRNNIGIYSGHNLNLVSKNDSNIVGKRVFVGDEAFAVGVQPAVLGDALVDLLYYLATEVYKAGSLLSSAVSIGNLGAPAPSSNTQTAGSGLTAAFDPFLGKLSKSKLREAILSDNVFISKQAKPDEEDEE